MRRCAGRIDTHPSFQLNSSLRGDIPILRDVSTHLRGKLVGGAGFYVHPIPGEGIASATVGTSDTDCARLAISSPFSLARRQRGRLLRDRN
jgi:hypothetical protein